MRALSTVEPRSHNEVVYVKKVWTRSSGEWQSPDATVTRLAWTPNLDRSTMADLLVECPIHLDAVSINDILVFKCGSSMNRFQFCFHAC